MNNIYPLILKSNGVRIPVKATQRDIPDDTVCCYATRADKLGWYMNI